MLLPLWDLVRQRAQSRRPLRRGRSGGNRRGREPAFLPTPARAPLPLFVHRVFPGLAASDRAANGSCVGGSLYSGISNSAPRLGRPSRAGRSRGGRAADREGDIYTVWQNEFFSRSVGTIYSIAGQLLGALPQTRLSEDAQAGILRDPDGRPVQPRYLLVDDSFTPAGRVLARDEAFHGITLLASSKAR